MMKINLMEKPFLEHVQATRLAKLKAVMLEDTGFVPLPLEGETLEQYQYECDLARREARELEKPLFQMFEDDRHHTEEE